MHDEFGEEDEFMVDDGTDDGEDAETEDSENEDEFAPPPATDNDEEE